VSQALSKRPFRNCESQMTISVLWERLLQGGFCVVVPLFKMFQAERILPTGYFAILTSQFTNVFTHPKITKPVFDLFKVKGKYLKCKGSKALFHTVLLLCPSPHERSSKVTGKLETLGSSASGSLNN